MKISSGVMASVYPTPHTNVERIWISSGRVPLHNILSKKKYLNFLIDLKKSINPEMIAEEINDKFGGWEDEN